MSLIAIYAASLVATFVAWYVCTLIPNRMARGVLRAGIIAFLCSPTIVVGHGIGAQLHEEPQVPNFGEPGRRERLVPGMVLAIEPMVNAGGYEVHMTEGYSHVDILTAEDDAGNNVVGPILDFLDRNRL